MRQRLVRRYAAERRFRRSGLAAVVLSIGVLAFLLMSMAASGWRGFVEQRIALPLDVAASASAGEMEDAVAMAAEAAYGADGLDYISESAWKTVRDAFRADSSLAGTSVVIPVPVSSTLSTALRGSGPETLVAAAQRLDAEGKISTHLNTHFLTGADGTDPSAVGIWGAFKGSLFTMLVTIVLAFPIGVLAAIYLEEFAPRGRWTDLIEVSINNLAAVPSIIFGLLGLSIFLNTMGLPRSAPLVGGMTLALMTLPVIVIAGRSAIKAVPPSIRDAALGVGASPVQAVAHHVLPAALPGIMTGSIIGMARALGETAPLLMIGMRAFITTPPDGISSPSSVLPVQIFLWSDEISRGFVEKTSAAIIVLLAFLLAMNAGAVYLRNRFEIRW
ncbi:MAG: phosphate ABC transporter permease PstA [Alphaproteobacteria bacterium]|nr:phosphate ABC transporter permease PstA [Alphaproteobacteria bacterium]